MRKILVGGLLVGVFIGTLMAENPYQGIVARNVFGLKDPPPPPRPEDNKPPLPKILLRGTASVLGRKLVVFDLEIPARPPVPASRSSMILGVGEAQDQIEVLEIVEATGTVTFRNHGVEEIRTFEKDSVKPVTVATPSPIILPGSVPGATTVLAPRSTGLQTIPTRTPAPNSAVPPPPPPPSPGAP